MNHGLLGLTRSKRSRSESGFAQSRLRRELGAKLLIAAAALLAIGSNFWPERPLLAAGLAYLAAGNDEGFRGTFLPHLLLYTTVPAIVSGLLWSALRRAALVPPPSLGRFRDGILPGVAAGLAALGLVLLVAVAILPSGAVRWVAPAPWKVAGNFFSNFYEELVYRGFLLTALGKVGGFWPAAIVSSAVWAILHSQYPPLGQMAIFATGMIFCWTARRTCSLWAPYVAHMVLDVIADSLIG